jgi:hypothetical protein
MGPRPSLAGHVGPAWYVAWAARVLAALLLVAGGLWWSRWLNFDGRSYCEVRHLECDGPGFEKLAPWILWPVTAFATVMAGLAAALAAPRPGRERVIWALMVGCGVFAAHRANVVWAAMVTAATVWGVLALADDDSEPARASGDG